GGDQVPGGGEVVDGRGADQVAGHAGRDRTGEGQLAVGVDDGRWEPALLEPHPPHDLVERDASGEAPEAVATHDRAGLDARGGEVDDEPGPPAGEVVGAVHRAG